MPERDNATIAVGAASGKPTLYFSHPSPGSAKLAQDRVRANLTVFKSVDQARTWQFVKTVDTGPSAYSAMALAPDNKSLLLLYDKGAKGMLPDPCQGKIPCWQTLAELTIEDYTGGND